MKPWKSMSRGQKRTIHETNRKRRLDAFIELRYVEKMAAAKARGDKQMLIRLAKIPPRLWQRWARQVPSWYVKYALRHAGIPA